MSSSAQECTRERRRLRCRFSGRAGFAGSAVCAAGLLDDLISRFPGLRSQLVEDEELAPFVNVYVEGEDVRMLDGLDTPGEQGSTVILLPAMAGGGV